MNADLHRARGAIHPLVAAALAVCVALTTTGCETLPQLGGSSAPAVALTPAEQQMRQDQQRFNSTVIGGVLTGAAVGAVGGALIGILSGDNKKEIGKKAVGGAVIGGVAGGIDGYVTAKREASGNNEIRALQAAAADVRKDNQNLQAYLSSSGTVLKEGQTRLAKLRNDVAAKRVSAEQAQQARQREEQNIASMNATLAGAKKTRGQYQEASAKFSGAPAAKRDLDAEITRMNAQVAQLENNVAEYNRALSVSRA